MKDTLVRVGAATVEAVPMMVMHNDGYVRKTHGEVFIAAQPHDGDQLSTSERIRWEQTVARRLASSSEGRWISLTVPTGGSQTSGMCGMHRGASTLSTPATKDTVKNLTEAEDRTLDDPTIQLGMAMVMSVVRKPTVGAMARLMRVMCYCIDRPTL